MPACFHFGEDRVPAGLDYRRDADHVDPLRDERADGLDLVFLLLLRVGELQLDAQTARGLLDRAGVGRAPLALGADLGKPHHQILVGFLLSSRAGQPPIRMR